MIQYLLAGLAMGGIYAIASVSLIATYTSSGILNLAFGSTAFFIARVYYYFLVQEGWPLLASAIVTICVVGPAIGLLLWAMMFRHLRLAPQFTRLACTIGLSIALPALASLIFGNAPIEIVPGLAPQPETVFHPLGVAISLDTVIVFGCTALVLIGGGLFLKLTLAGLKVRAAVDSEAMTSLTGISPLRISLGVSVVTTFLTGLAGVLAGPLIGLDTDSYLLFMTAAFAAMIAARLRGLGTAVCVSLAMGLLTGLAQRYLPGQSTISGDLISALPLFVIVAFLAAFLIMRRDLSGSSRIGGKLDEAIRPVTGSTRPAPVTAAPSVSEIRSGPAISRLGSTFSANRPALVLGVVLLAILPVVTGGYWLSLVGGGIVFAIAFVPITLLSGEGGMLWLCQITFAGIGALAVGQLSGVFGWPVLVSIFVSGLIAIPLGVGVGALTLRLGDLYVALVTICVGLLFETIVYQLPRFYNEDLGVPVSPPGFAHGARAFAYFGLAVLLVVVLLLANFRRGTTGKALRAAASSPVAARALGINVTGVKLVAAAFGAFASGVGGAMLAVHANVAVGDPYVTATGLVWFAVVASIGIRNLSAAVLAGLSFAILPGVFAAYLPLSVAPVPTCLFGLGAMAVARNPDGLFELHARQLRDLGQWFGRRRVVSTAPAFAAGDALVPDTVVAAKGASPIGTSGGRLAHATPKAFEQVHVDPVRPLLETREVTVQFGGIRAVDHVDFSARAARVTALIGPNGAGKSTMFAAISGIVRVAGGSVYLRGKDVTRLAPSERARLGLARTFQHTELFSGLTVRDHMNLADRIRHQPTRLWSDPFTWRGLLNRSGSGEVTRVRELLELLGLEEIADRSAVGLPSGLSRLVEVGRALASTPELLLLDEPSTGLDGAETEALMGTLRQVVDTQGTGIVLVEHDVQMVLGLADEIFVLDFGKIIAHGNPAQIRESAELREAYFGDSLLEHEIEAVKVGER